MVFALLSLAIGEQWIETRRYGLLTTFMGWFGFSFSVAAALLALYRLAFGPKFPVHLRSSGIRDGRYFRSEVAWTDVTGLTITRMYGGSSHLLLQLSAEGLQKLEWNSSYWIFGRLPAPMHRDGIYIPTIDLKTSPTQLETEIKRFLAAKNPSAL